MLTHLQVSDAKEILKSSFKKRSLEEQIAFFKMLEGVFEPNDEEFIIKNSANSNFEIQYSALKILKELNENAFNNIIKTNNKFNNNAIFKFVQS